MAELHRLQTLDADGKLTLVLTDTHLTLELDEATREKMTSGLAKGRAGAEKAPGIIGYVVGKIVKTAGTIANAAFEPKPLQEVEMELEGRHLKISVPGMPRMTNPEVDPMEAELFLAKFREAKARLLK